MIPHKLLKAYREPQDDTLYMHPTAADNLPGSNSPSSIRQSPDLYGPFWIPTTLIFILFVATNASKFLAEQVKSFPLCSIKLNVYPSLRAAANG